MIRRPIHFAILCRRLRCLRTYPFVRLRGLLDTSSSCSRLERRSNWWRTTSTHGLTKRIRTSSSCSRLERRSNWWRTTSTHGLLAICVAWAFMVGCGDDAEASDPVAERIEDILALQGDTVLGQARYTMECTACHDGLGGAVSGRGSQIRDVVPDRSDSSLLRTLLVGRACALPMPSFAALSDEDLAAILAHLRATFTEPGAGAPPEGCRSGSSDASVD